MKIMRVGSGFDVHPFSEGRDLVLGGVHIPFDRGLLGHSDADVLVHAIMDALLGAAAMGDIGSVFPDADPLNKDRASLEMLSVVAGLLSGNGYSVVNVDATVLAEAPKVSPYRDEMRNNIAVPLGVPRDRISIKATTTEKLGFTGRGEGIAAAASCLLAGMG
jgi:2-C-methyl-D-erythritol 2,4-cyclodiphosphate synthase